jgi:hypothetical protein
MGKWANVFFIMGKKAKEKKKDPTSMLAPGPLTWMGFGSSKMEVV